MAEENRTSDRDGLRAALDEIVKERNYQLLRWTPEHDKGRSPTAWVAVLTVYMGKAAMECAPWSDGPDKKQRMQRFRKRIRQVGAIAAAILESTADSDD